VWADAALKRGDKVAATARVVTGVSDLVERYGDAVLPLTLDVTDVAQVKNAVAQAHAHFGKLDVVLNNAGYALVAAVGQPIRHLRLLGASCTTARLDPLGELPT